MSAPANDSARAGQGNGYQYEKDQRESDQRARRQVKFDIGRRTSLQIDEQIIVAEPVDEVDAQLPVTAIVEIGVGQKVAVASNDDALFAAIRSWSCKRRDEIERPLCVAVFRLHDRFILFTHFGPGA